MSHEPVTNRGPGTESQAASRAGSDTSSCEDLAPRSPLLLSRNQSALVVIDVQEKLLPLVRGHARLVWNIRRLIDAATTLNVAVRGTEQYPKGLGPTVSVLRQRLQNLGEKVLFSCRQCSELFADLPPATHKLVLAGIETHVCVQQSAIDFTSQGYDVYVAVDAIGSRTSLDHEVALRRMEQSGITLTTTESVMFEWCETSGTPEFKAISALVREAPPED